MPTLTPVDSDPFAGSSAPPSSTNGAKLTPVDHDPFTEEHLDKGFTYKPEEAPDPNKTATPESRDLAKGIDIGFKKFGIGSAQLMSQVGTEEHNLGQIMPVFKDGKLTFGYPPREELAQKNEALNKAAEELGPIGKVGKFFSDPTLYAMPELKEGMAASMGVQGFISSLTSPSSDPGQTLGLRSGEAGLTGVLSAAGGGLLGKGAQYAKEDLPALGKAAMSTQIGQKISGMVTSLGPKAGQLIKDAGKAISDGMGSVSGQSKAASTLYSVADKLGLKFTGKETAEEVWNKITGAVDKKTNEIAENLDKGSSQSSREQVRTHEIETNLATSAMYDTATKAGGKLYEKASQLGEKEAIPAEGLADDIKTIIDHMEGQKLSQIGNPSFGRSLQALKDVHETITGGEEGGTESLWKNAERVFTPEEDKQAAQKITGNQLVEIDQALNENYGRTGFTGKGGRALKSLQNKTQEAINGMSPEFSAAYQKAKTFWKEQVIQKFEENPVLKTYWDVEDHRAFTALQKGGELPPALLKRVEGLADKIETYQDLAQLKKNLPPESYDRIRAIKFLSTMRKVGLNATKLGSEKVYNGMVDVLHDKPQDLAALDAIKTFMEQMNKRGIKKDLTPAELEESDKLKDRAARAILSYASGGKLNILKNTMEWVTKKSPEAMHGALRGVAKEAAKGAPVPNFAPGVIPKTVGAVAADKGGKVELPQ